MIYQLLLTEKEIKCLKEILNKEIEAKKEHFNKTEEYISYTTEELIIEEIEITIHTKNKGNNKT